jgi:CxxC motif-containing protein
MNKEMICIVCPVGCHLSVDEHHHVTGNKCPRGEAYAIKEATDPRRVLTSSVKTVYPHMPRLSVKSKEPIPKDQIFKAMNALSHILVSDAVTTGDVIIHNVLDTGIDIISTKTINLGYNGTKDVIK